MKAWNFKVKSNPQEIIKKLQSALGSVDGLVFNMDHDKNDSVTFKIRKRVLYGYGYLYNYIIGNGKMLKTHTENETDVEISFTQHFLTTLYVSMYWGSGLIAIIVGISRSATIMCIVGGILLVVGIALWIDVRKRFERNVQKYKTLISEIVNI